MEEATSSLDAKGCRFGRPISQVCLAHSRTHSRSLWSVCVWCCAELPDNFRVEAEQFRDRSLERASERRRHLTARRDGVGGSGSV